MAVRRLSSFSGHADKNDLLWWAKSCGANVKRFFLVHGELTQARALAAMIQETYGVETVIPDRGDKFQLT